MIRRPPRSTQSRSSAASDVYKRQLSGSVPEGTNVVMDLRENYNIFCSIVVYPVIPKGQLLLRLIPTSIHTIEDVEYTIKAFSEVRKNLEAGKYVASKIAQTVSYTHLRAHE